MPKGERLAEYNKNIKHKVNEYDITGEFGIGYALNTGNEFYFDIEDYDKIKDYGWYEHILKRKSGTEYHVIEARIPGQNKHIRLSQLIGCKSYDHIDQNPLNNIKSNLRPCSNSENAMNTKPWVNNTSGHKGVYYLKDRNKWMVLIIVNYKRIYLGTFNTIEEAINIRENAEVKYFKEFSNY